jgi:hypothetical protein
MHRLFITALLASVAFAPAYAGKKEGIQDRLEDRAFDKYEDKIERLEDRLQDAGDEERQRIENIIDSVTDKYEAKWGELPEEPPPDNPPPDNPDEPVQLFKDDFNRNNSDAIGPGWTATGSASLRNERIEFSQPNGDWSSTATNSVQVGPTYYETYTVSYKLSGQGTGKVIVSAAGDGFHFGPIATHDLTDSALWDVANPKTFTWTFTPEFPPKVPPYEGAPTDTLSFRFTLEGPGEAQVDDVVLVGNDPYDATPTFVGY